jgi:hypothetical protein
MTLAAVPDLHRRKLRKTPGPSTGAGRETLLLHPNAFTRRVKPGATMLRPDFRLKPEA